MFFSRAQSLVLAASAFIGMSFLSQPVKSQQVIKWDMSEVYPATSVTGVTAGDFARLVGEKSGGRIVVTVHYGGSLGLGEKDMLSLVEQGAVPVASTQIDKVLASLPLASVQFLPFLTGGLREAKAMSNAVRQLKMQQLAKMNQVLLYEAYGLPVGIWSKKAVPDLDTLKTIKLRTNNPNSTKTFQNAGAFPTFLAWSDVAPALSTGVIDAVLTSDESGISARFYEQLKFYTRLDYEIGVFLAHVNKTAFDALPADLKKAVMDAAAEAEERAYQRSLTKLEANTNTLKTNGVTIADTVSPAFRDQLQKAGDFLMDDWKKKVGDDTAKKILADFQDELKKTK